MASSKVYLCILTVLAPLFVISRAALLPPPIFPSSTQPATPTSSSLADPTAGSEPRYLRFVVFGDSYASGVTPGNPDDPDEHRDYDWRNPDLIRRCRRWRSAYAHLLKDDEDSSWTAGRQPYLDWPACSGATTQTIPSQVQDFLHADDAGQPADVGTLEIGGNDAGFFKIVDGCFYHLDRDKNYGPEYPDPTGECMQAISDSWDTILNPNKLRSAVRSSIDALLTADTISDNPDFRLFVLGYPEVFNETTSPCSSRTLRPWPFSADGPLVTKELRQAVGNIVRGINVVINEAVVEVAATDPRLKFLDPSPFFKGHRFCEDPNESLLYDVYKDAWLFGFKWPSPLLVDTVLAPDLVEDQLNSSRLDPLQVDVCWQMGNMDYPQPWDTQLVCSLYESGWPVESRDVDMSSGGYFDKGEFLRIMHPNTARNYVIAELLKGAIKYRYSAS